MRVTFLAHSGFLVELPGAALLFDWWMEPLPPLERERPLLIFASHAHPDHFIPKIFTLDDGAREVRFLLGKDIRLTRRNLEKWNVSPETAAKCILLGGNEMAEPLPGVTVETLPSTDEGVAFLVTADGEAVFHAGDLNWWHWEGEDKAWNNNMAASFRRYIAPLRGRRLDLAMLPLDPRQGKAAFWGPAAYLETADIQRCLPMHQWGEFAFTEEFLTAHPEFAGKIIPVSRNGQAWEFT